MDDFVRKLIAGATIEEMLGDIIVLLALCVVFLFVIMIKICFNGKNK